MLSRQSSLSLRPCNANVYTRYVSTYRLRGTGRQEGVTLGDTALDNLDIEVKHCKRNRWRGKRVLSCANMILLFAVKVS